MSNKMYAVLAFIVIAITAIAPLPQWVINTDNLEALQKERTFLDNIPIYRSSGATEDIAKEVEALADLGIESSIFLEDLSESRFEEVWNTKKAFNMLNINSYITQFLLWAIAIKFTLLLVFGCGLYISYKFDELYKKLKEDVGKPV